jgi:hypothetical protein
MQTTFNPLNNSTKTRPLETVLIGSGIVFLLTAFGLLLIYFSQPKPTFATDGIAPLTAADKPIQIIFREADVTSFEIEAAGKAWTVTPRATFQIAARVLGNRSYADWQSPLIPRDFALGWSQMADPAVDKWINWRQSGRWYYYNWQSNSPYKGGDIRNQSANIHIIPATDNLALALQVVDKGDYVYLEGQLVDIAVDINGRTMASATSLTRYDSGGGACEIFYVNKLIVDGQQFE